MNSKLFSRVSLVLLFLTYSFSIYYILKLLIFLIQRDFITLDRSAKVSYVFFFAVAVIILILSTVLLILALKSKWIIKIMSFIVILFILMSVYVIKDKTSPEGYTTTFDKEDKVVNISGEIVDKKIHDFMFNDNSEHYIKVKTKKELFPVKVIVNKDEYESLDENQKFKSKVGILVELNPAEPIT